MKLIVVCGNDACDREFTADTSEPEWICPYCQRVIENRNYPFLDAKYMDARARPEEADWEALYNDLLARAQELVRDRDAMITELTATIQALRAQQQSG